MLDGVDALGDTIRNWAKPVKGDCYSVRCSLCEENINISLRGHAQLVRHPSNQTHQSRRRAHLDGDGKLKKMQENQQDMFQFLKSSDSTEEGWKKRSLKDNVAYAEVISCTCTAVNNLPFLVANQVATRIKAFPRGEIDNLSDERLEYMFEEIPEDWYCRTAENTDDDEGEATDDEDTAQSRDQVVKRKRIDVYWSKVGKMTRPTGERKYSALMKLARLHSHLTMAMRMWREDLARTSCC